MKLLYCETCGDIFNLRLRRMKSCSCGKVKGMYVNNWEAISNGEGHSIAIGNGSFTKALYQKCIMEDTMEGKNGEYDRQKYLEDCRVEYCWIRPNDGNGNPHSFIQEIGEDE